MSAFRPATPDDAHMLTTLGRETFSATFAHLYPAEDLAAFLTEAHTPGQYRAWAADPAYGLWIAEHEGQPIGYALAGPNTLPHPDAAPGDGELKRIYVIREAQGVGAGSGLLKLALDWLIQPGRTLWIGVWSQNLGAQKLYRRHGFEKVGEYEFPVGASRDREFILRRYG